jgi:hypothetical protein
MAELFRIMSNSLKKGRILFKKLFIHLFICAYIVWAISLPCPPPSLSPWPPCFQAEPVKKGRIFIGLKAGYSHIVILHKAKYTILYYRYHCDLNECLSKAWSPIHDAIVRW